MTETLNQAVAGLPDRLLTLPDWDALAPDETHRVECSEGVLNVTPHPVWAHQTTVLRLGAQLLDQLPAELDVATDMELLLSEVPLTVRVPDLVLAETAVTAGNPGRLSPGAVALAVEVLADGSRRTDQVTKFSEYAEAGIVHYWLIDPAEHPRLSAYRLRQGRYRRVTDAAEPATITVADTRVCLDPPALATTGQAR